MRCLVTYPFFVRRGGRIYEVGEVFEGDDRTVARLVSRGLVDPEASEAFGESDLSALTVAELKALCDERGVDYPKKATKAQLLALLGE